MTAGVSPTEYLRFVHEVLGATAAVPEDAAMVAQGLLWANRGRAGQGLQRLPNLARRLARGLS